MQERSISVSKERNMGIECLRMLSMLMVVILHCLGHGGILKNAPVLSVNFNTAWLLETCCYGAVDLYALITGYVCICSKKQKWSRIMELWLQVALYSAGIALLFYFLPGYHLSKLDVIKAAFPIISKQYWYFSSYFCLFLFMPYLNNMLMHLSRQQHKRLILSGAMVFCCFTSVAKYWGGDVFTLNNGYSFVWLAFLYVIGAYIKLYQETFQKIKQIHSLLGYFAGVLLAWGSKMLFHVWNSHTKYANMFISYTSPFLVFGCVCLFLFFIRLNVRHGKKVIAMLSPLAFGVYIISENRIIRDTFVTNAFIRFVDEPWYLMTAHVLLGAVVIYLACTVIEFIRSGLFSLLHIRQLCDKAVDAVKRRLPASQPVPEVTTADARK